MRRDEKNSLLRAIVLGKPQREIKNSVVRVLVPVRFTSEKHDRKKFNALFEGDDEDILRLKVGDECWIYPSNGTISSIVQKELLERLYNKVIYGIF